ncbi:glycosyl transferase family 90-domain-containing protein [Aspergillus alliaceus]|uniref:Glycosyl transferase family 90-domain-containing protein n=1 Tax=Petromyces alliaceus TaxID=209559 RepID=A0A5N7CNQ4_PETAA|nr:glycosyl transferase family 90-domain-containing protein [Aspergillus alliaceus]KAB8239122.1 glycosyl transferase family 90-domain-containing protein [Aspergillus alliaceus]KAE8395821.1 glycosyl transferase family 90-domain-containing protein [Aspergillus alliaceus]
MISSRQSRYLLYLGAPAVIGGLGLFIWSLWFGVNSDRDNVPSLLNQLIPAGHCSCQAALSFQCASCLHCSSQSPEIPTPEMRTYSPIYDAQNRSLDAAQCQSFFPGLFEDIHRARQFWSVKRELSRNDIDGIRLVDGMARAAIVRGQLYVVSSHAKGDDHRRKILGILGSIHRALATNPDPSSIPDTEFIFSVEDKVDDVAGPYHPLWVLARKPDEEAVWLMPDFGFWAWEHGKVDGDIGPYTRVVDRIRHKEVPWEEKEAKLVWRGKLSFAAKMRRALLEAARNQPWADIKEIVWKERKNFISMEDHCRYQFIAHVEGRSYSASLKYRQACRSVVVAHKLQYIQHHHYLLISSGPDQNFVEVERDFSDLPAKMQHLLDNPASAERIANNSITTFRDRYLTPAAESCYWRELFSQWAAASPHVTDTIPSSEFELRGMRYESFLLLDSQRMLAFP